MIRQLINPFRYIAGGYALAIGVVLIVLTSLIGFFSHTHFPDVISVKLGTDYTVGYYIIQSLLNWIVVSDLLFLVSIIFSKSKVRVIDVFGTQALARSPYLLAALVGFSDAMTRFGDYILYHLMNQGEPIQLSDGAIIIAICLIIFVVLMTIWLITLMYNAFKVSANLKEPISIFLFIGSLIAAIIISAFLNLHLIKF